MKAESDEQIEQDERKNPIKRAQREKQFRTVGAQKEVFTKAQDIYETAMKYSKSFKTVKNVHPKKKELTIIDFSLAARGPQEDEIYATGPFFRNNIRRGNTVVFDNQRKEAIWARKGLMKFFDISQKSIKAIREEDVTGLHKKDFNNHKAIFSEIENVLSCNEELQEADKSKVHLYRLNKANGENAQIGYFPLTDEWTISSKNVCVFVSDRNDFKLYDGDRYQFSKLIGEAWFSILEGRSKQQLQALKKDLTGHSIIGQYCGNPDFQHLVKYGEITIYFYAVVPHASKQTCITPDKAFEFFERNAIPIVKNHEKSFYGKFTSYVELGEALEKLFKQVSTASIFQEEEGSVVYFVLEKPKKFCEFVSDRYLQANVPIPENFNEREIWWNVSSLGKLKTLEYRILRKLREKLKFFTRIKKGEETKQKTQNDQKKLQQKYGSFEREVYQLVKGEQLSKPLKYYFCAAIIAFDYANANKKSQRNLQTLSEHYLDFLSVIFWCIETGREVTHHLMADEELHKELRKTTWEKYGVEIVNRYDQMLAKFAPRYYKIRKNMNEEELAEGAEGKDQDPEE